MQDRVAHSPDALSQSTGIRGSHRTTTADHPQIQSRNLNLLGQLLGVVFWTAICASVFSWYVVTGTAAQTVDQNNILLDFSAKWCGPCQEMSPIVSKLERQGFPIRKVDVDEEQQLAQQFHIEFMPCFVLVANGREVTRITGKTNEKKLKEMMAMLPKPNTDDAPVAKSNRSNSQLIATSNSGTIGDRKLFPKMQSKTGKNNDLKLTPTDTDADTVRGQNPSPDDRFARDPLTASARIRVTHGKDIRYGSGTIIDSEQGRAIILTCGHILRGLGKHAIVEVDYYKSPKSKPQSFVADVLGFDLDADLGVLAISPDQELPVVKLGIASKVPEVKDRVTSVGCGGGKSPSAEKHYITAINRYQGADNLECDGEPEQGRSGGGLFLGPELIGVCIYADPKDKRGIYTGLKPVALILRKSKLSHLVPTLSAVESAIADVEPAKNEAALELGNAVAMIDAASQRIEDDYSGLIKEASSALGDSKYDSKFDSSAYVGAEIVCIVRPKTPGALSRVVVVNQATPRFVDDLLRGTSDGK